LIVAGKIGPLAATVVVPTTGDRGPLLALSVGSILAQGVRDLEVFIMGDGVTDATRTAIADLMRRDARIRFFDHPKHERRGEPHRHVALAEARGKIVCYLTDRDLMLPNHIEAMSRLLSDADFGHTLRFGIEADGSLSFHDILDINDPYDRNTALIRSPQIPLSCAGHTLDMYRRLPYGWRTTPRGNYTDVYMWQQFLSQPVCRTATSTHPTILYFKRGDHPGLPVAERLAELANWHAKIENPDWLTAFTESVRDAAIRDRSRIARRQKQSAMRQAIRRLRVAWYRQR
jgi:glycosyltransferase involved in cell wall biosynthesis